MSKNAPDYSGTFELASTELERDDLEITRKRLEQRRTSPRHRQHQSAKENGDTPDVSDHLVVKTESSSRKAFTLKVLTENEKRFHQLFCRLQLKGDSRKKQDLADEALELLFAKYQTVLC